LVNGYCNLHQKKVLLWRISAEICFVTCHCPLFSTPVAGMSREQCMKIMYIAIRQMCSGKTQNVISIRLQLENKIYIHLRSPDGKMEQVTTVFSLPGPEVFISVVCFSTRFLSVWKRRRGKKSTFQK